MYSASWLTSLCSTTYNLIATRLVHSGTKYPLHCFLSLYDARRLYHKMNSGCLSPKSLGLKSELTTRQRKFLKLKLICGILQGVILKYTSVNDKVSCAPFYYLCLFPDFSQKHYKFIARPHCVLNTEGKPYCGDFILTTEKL